MRMMYIHGILINPARVNAVMKDTDSNWARVFSGGDDRGLLCCITLDDFKKEWEEAMKGDEK